MRTLLFLVWSVACVGVGLGLASVEVDGKTPWQHASKGVQGDRRLSTAKDSAAMLVDDVKRSVSVAVKDVKDKPLDRHSVEERDALERLITDRQAPKR